MQRIVTYRVRAIDQRFGVVFEKFVDNKRAFIENGSVKRIHACVVQHLHRLVVGVPSHVGKVAAGDSTMQLTIFLLRTDVRTS